jgi:hypothetical protein
MPGMLIVVLRRYVTSQRWWVILLTAYLVVDVLLAIFIGDRLIRWELNYIKESWWVTTQ